MVEGAEKIIARILEDARLKAENNIKEAEKQASDIINAAKEEAEKKRNVIIENALKNADEMEKRAISVAELEARKIKLKAKQEIITSVFEKAITALNSLPAETYAKILCNMIISSVAKGNEEVVLSIRDKERLGKEFIDDINRKLAEKGLKGDLRLSEQTANINGGFILKSGEIEINNSFDTLIRMKRNELEPEIIKILFG